VAEREAVLVLAVGVAAAATLAVALVLALEPALVAGVAGLGVAWTAAAWSRGGSVPDAAILAAAAIFLCAELAYWSLEQAAVADEGELVARRAAELALRTAGALALAALLVAALGLRAGGGLALEAVGVAAAVGIVALVFALARAESAER
jgi:hypothetical protein